MARVRSAAFVLSPQQAPEGASEHFIHGLVSIVKVMASESQSPGVYVNQANGADTDVTWRILQTALGRTSRNMSQTAFISCLHNVRQEMHMPMSLEEFLEVEPGLTLLYMWIENHAVNHALFDVIEAFAYGRGSLRGTLEEYEIDIVDEMLDHCLQIVDAEEKEIRMQIARERQTPHRINGTELRANV